MKKMKQTLKFITYFVLLLFSIVIYVGASYLIFGFNTDLFYTPSYWVQVALMSLASIIIGIVSLTSSYDILEIKEPTYNDVEKSIKEVSKGMAGKELTTDIEKLNWENKKKAWIKYNDIKLANLERRINPKVAIELETLKNPDDYSIRTKKFIRKRNRLLNNLTEEFIENRLHYTKVDFEEINTIELLYGLKKPTSKKSMLERNILGSALFKKVAIGVFFAALSGVASLITARFSENWITFVTLTILNIIFLLSNVAFSIYTGKALHDIRTSNSVIRYEILKNYKEGIYKQLPEVPKRILAKSYNSPIIPILSEEAPEEQVKDILPLISTPEITYPKQAETIISPTSSPYMHIDFVQTSLDFDTNNNQEDIISKD